jgi:hypothetical protein
MAVPKRKKTYSKINRFYNNKITPKYISMYKIQLMAIHAELHISWFNFYRKQYKRYEYKWKNENIKINMFI